MAKARRVPLAIRTGYDAESDLGLVPYDPDPEVAEQNAEQLNAALAAQWRGGEFQFRDGTQGPILQPITFSAKTFYFAGEIRTTRRGGHTLIGGGGR